VGNTERRLVFEPRARCCLDQSTNILRAQHSRQPARIKHARQLGCEVGAAERNREKEAQGHRRTVYGRRLNAGLGLMNLIAAQVLTCCRIRRAPEKLGKGFDVADISCCVFSPNLRTDMSSIMRRRNGLMASAEIVDVMGGSCLEVGVLAPSISRQSFRSVILVLSF
jgi:hypothetical protein